MDDGGGPPRAGHVGSRHRLIGFTSFYLSSPDDLDEELREWLREAYRLGRQDHLTGASAASPDGSGPA